VKDRATSYLRSGVTPVIKCDKRLKLVLDEKLRQPIVAIAGKNADEMCRILSEKFLTRDNSGVKEILIPLQAFPAVSADSSLLQH